jgi:hypothetical protein
MRGEEGEIPDPEVQVKYKGAMMDTKKQRGSKTPR